ncbi:uncharacterized protein [Mytilus edulis]|uniref:uncharacterized protein n=1 Tax=Mytilus edulis TaxID=6550 RepID=UPI0039F00341
MDSTSDSCFEETSSYEKCSKRRRLNVDINSNCYHPDSQNDGCQNISNENLQKTFNYGDGVKSEFFKSIESIIHDLVLSTKPPSKSEEVKMYLETMLLGKHSKEKLKKSKELKDKSRVITDAERYIMAVLSVCSKEQRKELMKVTGKHHNDHVPLSLACKIGNLELVKFLVENCEADVNGNDGDGKPMLWAISNQEEDLVRYLLENKADPATNVGNCNLLMFSMKIFSYAPWPTFGYEEVEDDDDEDEDDDGDENKTKEGSDKNKTDDDDTDDEEEEKESCDNTDVENKKNENIPAPFCPKLEIVKMLIDYGAVEKCSESQLYDIFKAVLPEESSNLIIINMAEELYEACLPLLLAKVPNIASLKNDQGMTLLGYELLHKDLIRKCKISSHLLRRLGRSDGSDINNANIIKYYPVRLPSEGMSDCIETNIDTVLKSCSVDQTTNNAVCLDDPGNYEYVHPVVFLASGGRRLLHTCLNKHKVPFQPKFDALEAAGAYYAKFGYYKDAMSCWNNADKIRQQKVSNRTKKIMKVEIIQNPINISPWEKEFQVKTLMAKKLLNPFEGDSNVSMEFVYLDMAENARITIKLVKKWQEKLIRSGNAPVITVNPPEKSIKSHLTCLNTCNSKKLDKNTNTRLAMLLKGALIHERLVGYGSHETLKAFEALSTEYYKLNQIKDFVSVVTYSFPYFLRYISQEETYNVRDYTKTETLSKFITNLTSIVLTETKCMQLTFDELMAIGKCFFLHYLGTPKIQRMFTDIAPLLVALKVLDSYDKSEEQRTKFLKFMKRVASDDLRNCVGQSLLHYVTPVVMDREAKDLEKEVSGSQKLVQILLSSGADPNTVDDYGMTPLHLAYRILLSVGSERETDQMNIIQALLESGAHTDCIDAANRTPIWYSQTSSRPLCPVGTQSLQCLASAVIINSGVPYQGHHLPHIEKVVDLHKKRGKRTSDQFTEYLFSESNQCLYQESDQSDQGDQGDQSVQSNQSGESDENECSD